MTIPLFSVTRGTGPSLVLLHGWGVNSGVWEPLCETLEDHFRVTLIDIPGFGRNTSQLPAKYSLKELVALIAPCIPEQATLLGWSMGGLLAQQFALDFPSRLRQLILVASSPKFCEQDDWRGIKPGILEQFEKQLELDFSKTLKRFLAIQALGSASARDDIKQIQHHVQNYPLPSEYALRQGLKLLSETDLTGQLKHIAIPIHRLYGRLDSLVPQQAIEQIEEILKSTSLHIFPHASHAPFISHPEDFLRIVRTIFRK
jgi:pimeloyl-[acyl-carrier protein] methyl ester esterase